MGRLLDTIYAVPPAEPQGRCKLQAILEDLEPEDADDLSHALSAKVNDRYLFSGRSLSTALAQYKREVSPTTINEHRSRQCRCYRKVAA